MIGRLFDAHPAFFVVALGLFALAFGLWVESARPAQRCTLPDGSIAVGAMHAANIGQQWTMYTADGRRLNGIGPVTCEVVRD